MTDKLFRTLQGVALLIMGVLLLAPVAYAAENSGIGGKPANPRADNPRTESIFVYELSPGQSTTDAVEIYNNTDEQKAISVYATDSVISSGGAFACAQAADKIQDVGGWIKLQKTTVSLLPGRSEKVPFTVQVPDYAEPGEHNGCIAIQEANVDPASVGNGIALSFRSAIRVAITVPGEIQKELTIRDAQLRNKSDKLVGTILLRNNGNVSLDTAVTADLQNFFGTTVQSVSGTYPALPKTITELNFEYKKPYWGGLYRLNTTAAYNANIQETLGEGKIGQTVQKASSFVYVTPAPLALAIELAVLIGVLGLLLYLVQRYFLQPLAVKGYVDYKIKKGDDIQTIAAQAGVNWKHLAKVNKLKAPYALQKGQLLKIPDNTSPETAEDSNSTNIKDSAKKTKKSTKKEE